MQNSWKQRHLVTCGVGDKCMDYSQLIGNQQVRNRNGNVFITLKDLLPENEPMKMDSFEYLRRGLASYTSANSAPNFRSK